jgi:cell division protein FtsW
MTRILRRWSGRLEEYDGWLLWAVFVLCLLGTVMVYEAGSFRPEARGHADYLLRHLTRLALGLAALFVLAGRDDRDLRRPLVNWGLLGGALALMAFTVVMGLGSSRSGCARWLSFLPVQPIELAKVALTIFLAERLADPSRRWAFDRELVRLLAAPAALVVILALQPNFGNALVICLFTLVMLYAGGMPLRMFGLILGPLGALALLGVLFVDKITFRVSSWWAGLTGDDVGYQVHQSLIGMGAGGWHGFGFGGSHQRFWFLPESHTDFIFSVVGEELGLIGAVLTLALLVIVALRGYGIARRAPDRFGRFTATGLTTLLSLYAFLNMAMVTGVVPVMGLPLPFVSYGGSALVTNLAAVGLLLAIDRRARAARAAAPRQARLWETAGEGSARVWSRAQA